MKTSGIWNYCELYGAYRNATIQYQKKHNWFRPKENRPSLAVITTKTRKTVLIKKAA